MNGSYLYFLVKALLMLLFVLGLMFAFLWVLRYFMNKGAGAGIQGLKSPIRVVSTFFMGQKKNLTIVEVAGEWLLLGVTQNSISMLAKLENPDAIEALKKIGGSRKTSLFGFFNG